jgi:ZIP family zinc transporter
MNESFLFAITLSTLAGLSTGIGGLLVVWTRHTNTRFLTFGLGFSAGMMVYISFAELFRDSREALIPILGRMGGPAAPAAAFFAGILLVMLIDRLVPSHENPHEMHRIEETKQVPLRAHGQRLARMGLLTTAVIAIHNFPEGMTTFMAGLQGLKLGLPIAFAIAIHNIPEGIAAALPVYFATGKRGKAVLYSFGTGLIEPLGALAAYFFLHRYLNSFTFGIVFGVMAGVMVFISLDQLLPAAEKYGEHHRAAYGLVTGMAVMAGSLLLFL